MGDYQVYIASEECARDLGAPPAMTLGNNIFIRKESIRRMLWEKLQEWQWHKIENAMSRAFSFYDFKGDLAKALDRMTEVELTSIILHEQGEIQTTKILGEDWKDLLMSISSSRLELMLRGIKDYYADSVSTIPVLLQEEKFASIHFYAANLSAMRKELCPSFLLAYQQWCDTGKINELEKWVERSTTHWSQVINEVVLLSGKNTTEQDIEKFIEGNRL